MSVKLQKPPIDAIEQELNVDNLSAKDRKKLTEELCKLKLIWLIRKQMPRLQPIEKRLHKAEEKAYKERMRRI